MELNSQLTRLVRQLDAYQLNQLSPDEWLGGAGGRRAPGPAPTRKTVAIPPSSRDAPGVVVAAGPPPRSAAPPRASRHAYTRQNIDDSSTATSNVRF